MHTDTAPGQCVRLAARLDNGFGEVCKSFACARVASVRDHLSVLESSGDDLDSSKAHCCQSVRRGAELSCAPIKRERASESGLDRWRKVLHQRCKSYHSSERAPQSGRLWGLRRSFSVALSAPEICSKISGRCIDELSQCLRNPVRSPMSSASERQSAGLHSNAARRLSFVCVFLFPFLLERIQK